MTGGAFVNEVDDGLEHAGVGVLMDTVAEIENVARVASVVGEHCFGTGQRSIDSSQYE